MLRQGGIPRRTKVGGPRTAGRSLRRKLPARLSGLIHKYTINQVDSLQYIASVPILFSSASCRHIFGILTIPYHPFFTMARLPPHFSGTMYALACYRDE